ncbi:MAG: 30S ribosomal protein S20 [Ardenticatenaceae bacterium]|nr:30S ribosomal protein S20 [Ardenticatenaceae bacterium]
MAQNAYSTLDKAARKNIIHHFNAAARHRGRAHHGPLAAARTKEARQAFSNFPYETPSPSRKWCFFIGKSSEGI